MTDKAGTPARRWIDALNRTIWQTRRGERSAVQWLLIRLARTAILAASHFNRHQGPLRASALTFYSLLSLVPVAAMAFGIAKGFGFEKRLQKELLEEFAAQQEVVVRVIDFAQNMLDNTEGGMMAGVGIVVLFWAVIKVLGNIENAFNHIWAVPPRNAVRKLTDYLTIMLIGPVLMTMSSSVTVYITSQVSDISGRFALLQLAGPAIYVALKLLPYALIWILFTLVYMIMPNTRVRLDSALLAGILAGTAFQVLQAAYIHLQIFVAKYNAIYGSFAALPLFLVWLQTSWLIVLFGGEISHAYQNAGRQDLLDAEKKMSIFETKLLALTICRHVVNTFRRGSPPRTASQIADSLAISPEVVQRLADLLVEAEILVQLDAGNDDDKPLQPARHIDALTVSVVMNAVEEAAKKRYDDLPEAQPAAEALAAFRAELEQSPANRRIADL
ncbi:MAG: YihY/virulence factor BrkB family protein [Deltaproteobacteria bacterium]|nr:YihY/virulence factor BrkB family protein [Deltaproteobacteria bacterium]MBW2356199.1 YihY/virulence factor BrkB family protein [Deltaproteobacteria bacterium]